MPADDNQPRSAVAGVLSYRRPTMATPSEITGLTIALANTDAQIDKALDIGDERAFKVWCQRRASLLAKIERTLLAVATTEVPA